MPSTRSNSTLERPSSDSPRVTPNPGIHSPKVTWSGRPKALSECLERRMTQAEEIANDTATEPTATQPGHREGCRLRRLPGQPNKRMRNVQASGQSGVTSSQVSAVMAQPLGGVTI